MGIMEDDIDKIVNTKKGRGFALRNQLSNESACELNDKKESFEVRLNFEPTKSIEGWIIIVTGLHEEAQEEDIHETFAEFGEIRNMHMNLDRQTGFVKGYALVEFDSKKNAERAIKEMNGKMHLGRTINVDWAFSKSPI